MILARLAFDRWLDPATIPTRPDGIDGPAGPGHHDGQPRRPGGRPRGRADHPARGDRVARRRGRRPIAAAVLPTALPLDSALGRTAGVRNRIEVDAVPVGRVGFDGPGAGGAATSSAVLGDLIAIARGAGSTWGSATAPAVAAGDASCGPTGAVLHDGQRHPVPDR